MTKNETDNLAEIIWNYHHLNQPLQKADCIFVLGSHDTRVADRAINLYQEGFAPYIIFSGGYGNLTRDIFHQPEAEIFANMAIAKGIPKEKFIIENRSTNTGENVQFTKQLLKELNLDFQTFILVQKPYMERRTYATFKKNWPEKEFVVTSPQITFNDYPNSEISKDQVINIMIGDLQRIKEYPARGFQIHQDIPKEVWNAYEKLVAGGYNKHLIKD